MKRSKLSNLNLDIKSLVLGTFAGTVIMLCVGATPTGGGNKWEYKLVGSANTPPNILSTPEKQEALLNDLGTHGWTFVQNEGGWLYFMRPKR
jgi:hypothetical protein